MLKTYFEKWRYPKWPPFDENLGQKIFCILYMFMPENCWLKVIREKTVYGKKIQKYWVPRNGQQWSKISRNWQIFTKWVPRFLKICFNQSFLQLCMQEGFLEKQLSISWHYYWKMASVVKFWAILGHFRPFLDTQYFWIFVPCIIFSVMTFS